MILKEVDTFIADDTELGDVNTHKMRILVRKSGNRTK